MSYDIRLLDPVTRKPILFDKPHDIKGGTYAADGTNEAWLNVTENSTLIFPRFQHFNSPQINAV